MFDLFPLTIGKNELDHQASHSLGVPSFQECGYFLGEKGTKHTKRLTVEDYCTT